MHKGKKRQKTKPQKTKKSKQQTPKLRMGGFQTRPYEVLGILGFILFFQYVFNSHVS
jgi:hypothetical protein